MRSTKESSSIVGGELQRDTTYASRLSLQTLNSRCSASIICSHITMRMILIFGTPTPVAMLFGPSKNGVIDDGRPSPCCLRQTTASVAATNIIIFNYHQNQEHIIKLIQLSNHGGWSTSPLQARIKTK